MLIQMSARAYRRTIENMAETIADSLPTATRTGPSLYSGQGFGYLRTCLAGSKKTGACAPD